MENETVNLAAQLPAPQPGMRLPKMSFVVALEYMRLHRLDHYMFWGDQWIVKIESLIEFARDLSK